MTCLESAVAAGLSWSAGSEGPRILVTASLRMSSSRSHRWTRDSGLTRALKVS